MIATATQKQRLLINPSDAGELYDARQFSQAVRVNNILLLPGQMGIGPDGSPGATIEDQTRFAFQNLVRVLEAAGATMAAIVELTTYLVSVDDLPKVAAVKAEFITHELFAWTVMEVTQLALPGMLIEVKATAMCDS